jgi:sugar/nucleoside kinase (ribokinase family)
MEEIKETVRVIFDSGRWKPGLEHWFSRIDTAIVSSAFALPGSETKRAVCDLSARGIRVCAQTHGPAPLYWVIKGKSGHINPPTTNAVDSLGAGDIFHGAYCYYRFVAGLDDVEAMELAASVAAKSTEFEGPREGIRKFLTESQRDHA